MALKRINVTESYLPDFKEYEKYLKQIWDSKYLTNQGPLLKELELELSKYLKVDNIHLVSNGTIALQLALKALDISEGEVITTPFSYVATISSILWERCTPVFVDIEPKTFSIDANQIEAAITSKTKAIMPVHVFGNPCDTESIEAIAKTHNLKVIYDAAHAFGVIYKGKPLVEYGDISTLSFHATKLFNTIEGGAVIVKSKEISDKVELIKRFGHNDDDHQTLGINAKMSEFSAAMGLCNLRHIEEIIDSRKQAWETYGKYLAGRVIKPVISKDTQPNYTYYPILLSSEKALLDLVTALNDSNIYPRRYFFPSLNKLKYLNNYKECKVSEDIATRILCLPLFAGLKEKEVIRICEIVNKNVF